MSRRRRPEKRVILPDPKFGDITLSKFMNSVMLDGKKSVAESIVYGALETVEARLKKDPLGVFHEALTNIKPGIEVRSRFAAGWRTCHRQRVRGQRVVSQAPPVTEVALAQELAELDRRCRSC